MTLAALREGQEAHGFVAKARYLDAADEPIGARFVHTATGFTFDYLAIESAPQGFLWVHSLPTSDMGEPHTQEHLLLGKGDRGRRLGSVEAMALGESSAFTEQWYTAYHFHTVAGPEAYWTVFDNQLIALLDPDYTDLEIEREVAHLGVTVDATTGQRRLEEKGTVYNEMVRSYENPRRLAWQVALDLVHGKGHALSLSSGGLPDDIRRMTAKDIRDFHAKNYHLANMGIIGAFPAAMPLDAVLARTGAILGARAGKKGPVAGLASVGASKPGAIGSISTVEFPYQDAKAPGELVLAWPATRHLGPGELVLLELVLSSIAGDESTNLYKLFVDSKTRQVELGASGVWTWIVHGPGQPIFLGFPQVASGFLDDKGAAEVRARVRAELARIAALPPGDPELVALGERVKSRLASTRRGLSKFLNTPPGFGIRGTGSGWMDLLVDLEGVPGFERSLAMKPQLAEVEAALAEPGNPWTARFEKWGLTVEPYVVIARPSPDERARLDRERGARLAAATQALVERTGAKDAEAALAVFAAEYDRATAELEASQAAQVMPPLVDDLPMTLDDGLDFRQHAIAGVPAVSSTFPGTTAGLVGVAFRLDGVPADLQVYLPLLPALLTDSGAVIDGQPVTAEEVAERRRREVLALSAWLDTDVRTGRVELVVEGQGIDVAETQRAVEWMLRSLHSPFWDAANLPRLRDLADQSASELRAIMLRAEEAWVHGPRDVYARQRSTVYARAASALTMAHDAHRLRWMLLDPGDAATREAAAKAISGLPSATKGMDRARRMAFVARLARGKLSPAAHALLLEAGKDLTALLPAIPDDALAEDFAYLCRQMAGDLRRGAPAALADLARLRELVVRAAAARLYVVGSAQTHAALAPELERLVGTLGQGAAAARLGEGAPFIDERLRARVPAARAPVFVGLVNPSTQGGAFLHVAPATGYTDTGDEALLDYLASNLYTGHGAHSLFLKTWAAGLAYSNGARVGLRSAQLLYYAERCPELPETMRFVVGEMEKASPDASIVSYALAQAFSSRVAQSYESRGRAIAEDLADGLGPEVIKAFRERLLRLRERRDLAEKLAGRFRRVYAEVMPGLGGPGWTPATGAVYLVIGPDAQLDAWQKYLYDVVGKDAKLWKLYPRDYWVVR